MGNENQGPPRGSELKWLSHAVGGCALPAENLGKRRRRRRKRRRHERRPSLAAACHPLTTLYLLLRVFSRSFFFLSFLFGYLILSFPPAVRLSLF
jgi:hypothetical protein